MTALGWTALGALTSKLVAQSGTSPEILAYVAAAIAVCGGVATLVVMAEDDRPAAHPGRVMSPAAIERDAANALRSLAEQMLFAESRGRLRALAQRLEKTDGVG